MKLFRPIFSPVLKFADSDEGGEDPGKQQIKMIIAIAAIIVAAIGMFFYFRGGRPPGPGPSDLAPFIGLGEVTAQETAKLLDNKGKIVVVANDPSERALRPHTDEMIKAFQKGIKQVPDINVVATETVLTNPDSTSAEGLGGDVFLDVVKKNTDIDAIVSLVGPPVLTKEQVNELPQKVPKFLAVVTTGTPLKQLFQMGWVQVAIVPRIEPGPAPTKSTVPRDRFDQQFQVITSENANLLRN